MTARDLGRMGVEVHLGAMVTDIDDDGVELTQSDGNHLAYSGGHQGVGRGHAVLPWGPTSPPPPGAKLDRSGRVQVAPDCSVPATPRSSSWAISWPSTTCPAWPRWRCSRAPTPPTRLPGGYGAKTGIEALPLP